MKKKIWTILVLACALIASTSCADSIHGNPQPGMTPVDLTKLKTGALDTEPSAYEMRLTSGAKNVRYIEARRMLNFLVHPFDVDGDITDVGYVRLFADADSMTADGALPEDYKPVAEKNKLLAGAYVSRTNGSTRATKKLIISTLRFPTPADATNAANDFDRTTFERSSREQRERHPIPIKGQPEARATSADDLGALSSCRTAPTSS